jgi:hypothetical protein
MGDGLPQVLVLRIDPSPRRHLRFAALRPQSGVRTVETRDEPARMRGGKARPLFLAEAPEQELLRRRQHRITPGLAIEPEERCVEQHVQASDRRARRSPRPPPPRSRP